VVGAGFLGILLLGFWSSKIGKSVDIEHTLEGLEGSFYGQVAIIMRRCDRLP